MKAVGCSCHMHHFCPLATFAFVSPSLSPFPCPCPCPFSSATVSISPNEQTATAFMHRSRDTTLKITLSAFTTAHAPPSEHTLLWYLQLPSPAPTVAAARIPKKDVGPSLLKQRPARSQNSAFRPAVPIPRHPSAHAHFLRIVELAFGVLEGCGLGGDLRPPLGGVRGGSGPWRVGYGSKCRPKSDFQAFFPSNVRCARTQFNFPQDDRGETIRRAPPP